MTIFFKNHEIQIYRKRRITGTDRYNMSATYTAYAADIQPATRERIEMFNGRWGAVFTAFIDASIDIKENDQVLTEDGKRYSVKGVQKWSGAGLLDHIEMVLVAQDGY
jgi:hypothetical protein